MFNKLIKLFSGLFRKKRPPVIKTDKRLQENLVESDSKKHESEKPRSDKGADTDSEKRASELQAEAEKKTPERGARADSEKYTPELPIKFRKPEKLKPNKSVQTDSETPGVDRPAESRKIAKKAAVFKRKKAALTEIRERYPGSKPKKIRKKIPAVNKHGIPVFDREESLSDLFIGKEPDEFGNNLQNRSAFGDDSQNRSAFGDDSQNRSAFGDDSQNRSAFGDDLQNRSALQNRLTTERFSEMVEKSIAETDFEAILAEKEGASAEKIIPVTDIIKTYPLPEDEIDLHGYTSHEAEAKIGAFIQSSHKQNFRTLRIIFGKGLHSGGRAVLRDVTEDKVTDLKKRNIVLSFKWENRDKSRSGSMIVYLR